MACNQEKEQANKSNSYNYLTLRTLISKSKSINETVLYKKYSDENNTIYEYKTLDNDSTYFHFITKELTNDNSILLYDQTCELIDTKVFNFKGVPIKVFKYLYDVNDSIDEEHDYYFTNEYGVIFSKSIAWSYPWEFYNELELKPLQDSILKNEEKFKSSFNFLRSSN